MSAIILIIMEHNAIGDAIWRYNEVSEIV